MKWPRKKTKYFKILTFYSNGIKILWVFENRRIFRLQWEGVMGC
jgi:hypothetical protein